MMRLSCPDLTRSGQLNVAAILGHGSRKLYKHRDLDFVVDLSGYALPANRLRVATEWVNDIIEHRQLVQFAPIPREYSGLTAAGHAGTGYQTDGQPPGQPGGVRSAGYVIGFMPRLRFGWRWEPSGWRTG